MRKSILLIALMMLAASVSMTAAQTSPTTTPVPTQQTTTTTTTQATQTPSSVNVFYVACENQGVINFDGTMQPGFDIYYQLFSGPNGSGTALTSLRHGASTRSLMLSAGRVTDSNGVQLGSVVTLADITAEAGRHPPPQHVQAAIGQGQRNIPA